MGLRILYSIQTHFHFLMYDFVYDHTCRVVSFFCSYLFGLLSRRFFRNEESRNIYEYESNPDAVLCRNLETDQREKQSISRYEIWSGKGISKFLEGPTTLSFTIHESNLVSDISAPVLEMQQVGLDTEDFFESVMADDEAVSEKPKFIDDGIIAPGKDFGNHEFETEKTEDPVQTVVVNEVLENPEMENIYDLNHKDESSNEEFDKEEESVRRDDVFVEDTDSSSKGVSGIEFVDQLPEPETIVLEEDNREMEATTDSDGEYIESHPKKQNLILSKDEDEEETSSSEENQESKEPYDDQVFEKSKESRCLYEEKKSDFEVEKETEYLAEHEDLIQQLKLELKLARTGGLPTILEGSESEEFETPKTTVQHLKPMKINDQKLDYKHLLEGIRKVYKNYSDKMRKLDTLNFQTMHALGLLEIKGTADFQGARKSSSVPAIMSLLSHNLWPCKGSAVIEPMKRVIADMNRDLESVYIGQLCLSWEILHWQYWKAQELRNYASQGSYFNQVANEFQLFQVLVQRFLENEQFQGPRIRNYVNSRCVLRSLLHVPLLRDDNVKDKGKGGNEDTITSHMLTSIIEQSIKVFWDFVRADKDGSNALFQSQTQPHSNLEKLVNLELLTDVRTEVQKKEKKLKDVLRSGNCIVKRFKKQKEEDNGMNQRMLIAQVEMKLVAKVLNMSSLTADKLIWCHEKLEKINVSNRKVSVESSFLLFPC